MRTRAGSDPRTISPKAAGTVPAGLSGRDMALRMARHPEHEDGSNRPERSHEWWDADTIILFHRPQWHRRAACANLDFDFLGAGRGIAKAVCATCPVWQECLDDALRDEVRDRLCHYIRGGLTAEERLELVKESTEADGTVYFAAGDFLIKIGTTRLPVAERLKMVEGNLHLLATEQGSYTREAALHKRFASARVSGEWFEPVPELLAYIDKLSRSSEAREAEGGADDAAPLLTDEGAGAASAGFQSGSLVDPLEVMS